MTARSMALGVGALVSALVVSNVVVIASSWRRAEGAPRRASFPAPLPPDRALHRVSTGNALASPAPVSPAGANADGPGAFSLDAPYGAPRCPGLRVATVAVSADAARSLAILEGPAGRSAPLAQRDVYADRQVWWVAPDRVWLTSGGGTSLCQVGLREDPAVGPRGEALDAAPVAAIDPLLARIERRGEGDYHLDRATFTELVEQAPRLARGVRTAFEQENGVTVGVRLSGVRAGDLPSALGLSNGDRVEQIAGVSLTGPDRALEAYARLLRADHVALVVRRGGALRTIDVTIQ